MVDPVRSLAGLVPRKQTRTVVHKKPLKALPRLTPYVSQREQRSAKADELIHAIEGGGKSLGAQIGGVFGGIPSGLVHLGKEVGTDLTGFVRAPIASWQNRGKAVITQGPGGPQITSKTDNAQKYFPFLTGVGHSFEDTAGRVAQLSPYEIRSVGGRKVDTYGDLIDQGNIVSGVLSDVGNLSIAGGAAARGLGVAGRAAESLGATETAARLGKASEITSSASRLGGRVANAPMEIGGKAVGTVLGGGKSLWREAGQRLEARLYDALPKDSPLGLRMVKHTTEAGRLLGEASVELRTKPSRLGMDAETRFKIDAGILDPTKRGSYRTGRDIPSAEEVEVGLSRASGVSQTDKWVSDQIGADTSIKSHIEDGIEVPGQTITRDGQVLGHAYEDGTIDPASKARIDKVERAWRKWSGKETDKSLEGSGRLKGALPGEQTGDLPLNDAVAFRLKDAGMAEPDIAAAVDLVETGQATWNDLAQQEPALNDILLDPDVYPAPWREAMNVTRQGTIAGAVGLPRTPQEMLDAGLERPAYMSGAKHDTNAIRSPGTVPITEGFGGLRKIGSEQHKSTLGHGQYSLEAAASALARGARDAEYDRILTGYMRNNILKGPEDILSQATQGTRRNPSIPPVDMADLHNQAVADVDHRNLIGASPSAVKDLVDEKRGELVISELNKRGYDVLQGDRYAPKAGDFDPSARVDPKTIGPGTVVIPAGLKQKLKQHMIGVDTNAVLALNQKTNSWLKRNVLPLNAHWTLGDMISNLQMAWTAGEISPVEMMKAGRRLKGLVESNPDFVSELLDRPEFVTRGLKMQVAEAMNGDLLDRPAPTWKHPVAKIVRPAQNAGFRLNELANRVQRHEYVTAKLDRVLQERGLAEGVEDLASQGSAKWKEPEVQQAINDVINDGNKVLGTWEEMSPKEQRIATQIWPFWSWTRHITSLAARTAIDNPTRVLWTLRLGALGMNTNPDDLPSWMQGSIGTPWGRVNVNWANPFYDVGTGGLLAPGAALRQTSPLIKFATTAITNRDLSRDGNIVTHRPKTHPNRLGSALYQLGATSPFIRGALNLAPTGEIPGLGIGTGPHRRYGSGQTILTPHTDSPVDDQFRPRLAANMFNLPIPQPDVKVQAGSLVRRKRSGLKKIGASSGLKRTGLRG